MNEMLKVQCGSGSRWLSVTVSALAAACLFAGCGKKEAPKSDIEDIPDLAKATAPAAPAPVAPPPGLEDDPTLPLRPTAPTLKGAKIDESLPDPDMAPKGGKGGENLSIIDTQKARAENGDRQAAYFVGYKYYAGEGAPQDFEEAAKWLKKAADLNQPDAQHLLGKLYEEGKGVPQNKVLAYGWYRIASRKDNTKAIADAGRLSNELTSDEIDEGERLAKDFVPE